MCWIPERFGVGSDLSFFTALACAMPPASGSEANAASASANHSERLMCPMVMVLSSSPCDGSLGWSDRDLGLAAPLATDHLPSGDARAVAARTGARLDVAVV